MDFYEAVIALCKEKGISVTALVVELGISKSAPANWKNGSAPRAATVKKIADYFGVSPDEITGERAIDTEISVHTVKDNHGIIGHASAPVMIVNGDKRELTSQEAELLHIFEHLSVMDQARLLIYANDLTNGKRA